MKKTLAVVLSCAMLLGLAACGNDANSVPASSDNNTTTSSSNSNSSTATVDVDTTVAESMVSSAFIDPVSEWSKYDEIVAQIKSETDFAHRTELMHQAEDILMSNYCVIPLYYYNDIYMQKDYVKNLYSNAFGTKFFMYGTMDNGSTTLRLNLASEPDYLDPALNSSVDGACLAANSFSGLYTYDANGKTVPALAEGYTVSDDGLTFTVTLKSDLKWSDGSPLTAKDFEYSWKRAVAPETAADYEYMFSNFTGYGDELDVTAIDDTTLQFSLIAPCAYIEDLMAFPVFYPVCQSYVEANSNDGEPGSWCTNAGFVSCGAYVCTSWTHDVAMTYEKNPYWYDADKVTIEKLEFMLSDDDTAIYAAYNSGDLDFIDTVPTDEIGTLISNNNGEFYIVDQLGTYYVAFNAKSSLFDGKTPAQAACMREAFSLLIDRDYICDNIGQTGQIAADSYIPAGMADGNGGVFKGANSSYYDAYAINNDQEGTIERARELLKAAGYLFDDKGMLSSETPIKIEYLTNTTSGHIAVAESIQQDLAAVGIVMTIQQQDWNVFLEERKAGNFDIAREGWVADFNDPINMIEMFTTDSGNNDCQYGR